MFVGWFTRVLWRKVPSGTRCASKKLELRYIYILKSNIKRNMKNAIEFNEKSNAMMYLYIQTYNEITISC